MAGTQHVRVSPAIHSPSASNEASVSPRSRIHFPDQEASRPGPTTKQWQKGSALGPDFSSSRRVFPPASPPGSDLGHVRRRIRSTNIHQRRSRTNLFNATNSDSDSGFGVNTIHGPNKGKGPASDFDSVEDVLGFRAFSDEYDLSHDDPRIFQDVQHALKVKARRDARLKLEREHPPEIDVSRSDVASGSSSWSASSPPLQPFPTSSPVSISYRVGTSMESEIDFSPSIGVVGMAVPLHPVPSSSNNGTTLDWSKPSSEDEKSERRWTLSMSKRKNKDQVPILSSVAMEKQQVSYIDKLNNIKANASSQSLRKAEIIAQQLRRRYNIIYRSLGPESCVFNLASVARWYGGQDIHARTSLEEAEPLTWLKHLDKSGINPSSRLPWHLSALMVEEYIHSHKDVRDAISERHPSMDSLSMSPSPPPESSNASHAPIPSRALTRYSTGPSLSRRRSFEGHVSFEAVLGSMRSAPDVDASRTGEVPGRVWRSSLPDQTESAHSSIYSDSYQLNPNTAAHSPANSLTHLSGRITRRHEGVLSSSRNSISERSEDDRKKAQVIANQLHQANVDLQSESGESIVDSGVKLTVAENKISSNDSSLPQSLRLLPGLIAEGEPYAHPPGPRREPLLTGHRVFGHKSRRSLGSSDAYQVGPELRRRQDADDEKVKRAYHLKALLLDDAIAQNQRIRQLLKRVAIQVKEYDRIQSSLMKSLGVPYRNLPQGLLEAFSHDPSAGLTRSSRGWEAVEDIYSRLARQREAFQDFLTTTELVAPSTLGSVLRDPITNLLQSLETLEVYQLQIVIKAREVADTLSKVKTVHAAVKANYNGTLSHTSVVYPELSLIVALEESYKDQYQQFWEFGMDALTFLLDTVAPFWRTYGKTIGEDVQDFLIIPLYRNEFTGELKRYPINGIPKRAFRHWIGLMIFFALACGVTLLQTRAAITSSIHFRLQWISHVGIRWMAMPFFWIGIIIQWCAALTELSVVMTQLAVVTWWIGWSVKIFD